MRISLKKKIVSSDYTVHTSKLWRICHTDPFISVEHNTGIKGINTQLLKFGDMATRSNISLSTCHNNHPNNQCKHTNHRCRPCKINLILIMGFLVDNEILVFYQIIAWGSVVSEEWRRTRIGVLELQKSKCQTNKVNFLILCMSLLSPSSPPCI